MSGNSKEELASQIKLNAWGLICSFAQPCTRNTTDHALYTPGFYPLGQFNIQPNKINNGKLIVNQKKKKNTTKVAYFCSNLLQEIFPSIHHLVISSVV